MGNYLLANFTGIPEDMSHLEVIANSTVSPGATAGLLAAIIHLGRS